MLEMKDSLDVAKERYHLRYVSERLKRWILGWFCL